MSKLRPRKIIKGKEDYDVCRIFIAGLMFGENFARFIAIEDISRHVAADKIFGYGIINKINFADCIFFTSGILPADIVGKISRMGIPIAATRTAITYAAIKVAENTNVALIGFVRGDKFNIYAHPERIKS